MHIFAQKLVNHKYQLPYIRHSRNLSHVHLAKSLKFVNAIMSVAQYQMPSAVAAGAGWNPNMQQPNMGQPMGASNGEVRGPAGAVGPAQAGDSRGELTGDNCLTFDLFMNPDDLVAAQWSEETCECNAVSYKSTKTISFSSVGRNLLLDNDLTTKEVYLSEEISVGKSLLKEEGTCNPLQRLCDARAVEVSHDINIGASSNAPLAGLVSLLLAHSLNLSQTASAPSMEKPKKKGKKSKRVKQSVTLVSPVGLNQTQRAVLVSAAEQAEVTIKNIFNRAVAVVAGSLFSASRLKGKTLLDVLHPAGMELNTPTVLYLNVYSLSASGDLFYDAALIRCDGSGGAKKVGAKLGFERLNTLATQGGRLPPASEVAPADHLKSVVDFLFSTINDVTQVLF